MDAGELLAEASVVAVVVIADVETSVELAQTLVDAGIRHIEVTLRTPTAVESIRRIASAVPQAIVGAGSIRRASQFSVVVSAGARFAVSPGSSDNLVAAAAAARMPFVPGAVTATESIRLLELGYRLQKFFPAELAGGIPMIKAIGAPIPEVRFFPTGGISVSNAGEYLAMGNVACVGGSWLAPAALLQAGDFEAIGSIARDAARLGV